MLNIEGYLYLLDAITSTGSVDNEDDVIFIREELPSMDLIKKAESFQLPKWFYNYLKKPDCPGCRGCIDDWKEDVDTTTGSPKQESNAAKVESGSSAPQSGLFSSMNATGMVSFSQVASGASLEIDPSFLQQSTDFKFQGTGQALFSTKQEVQGDENPEAEANVYFKPIASLPETYEYKTCEKESEVVFEERCKLYRHDDNTKQWKERGVGTMKMMRDKSSGRIHLLMRRDQILKICCNHYIVSGMKIDYHTNSEKALLWFTTADYSEEGNPLPQKLVARFKLPETAKKFKDIFEEAASDHKVPMEKESSQQSPTESSNVSNSDDSNGDDGSSHSSMPPLDDC